jgi:hypothetical protein
MVCSKIPSIFRIKPRLAFTQDLSLRFFFLFFFLEKSYDTIPNFTAADGVRLLGIGRNQFIDIMNQCRQKVEIEDFQ